MLSLTSYFKADDAVIPSNQHIKYKWAMISAEISRNIAQLIVKPPATFSVLNLEFHLKVGDKMKDSFSNPRFIFYIASILIGMVASPLYSLDLAYIGENVKQRYS